MRLPTRAPLAPSSIFTMNPFNKETSKTDDTIGTILALKSKHFITEVISLKNRISSTLARPKPDKNNSSSELKNIDILFDRKIEIFPRKFVLPGSIPVDE